MARKGAQATECLRNSRKSNKKGIYIENSGAGKPVCTRSNTRLEFESYQASCQGFSTFLQSSVSSHSIGYARTRELRFPSRSVVQS